MMTYSEFRKIMLDWGVSPIALPKQIYHTGTYYIPIKYVTWLAKATKRYANDIIKYTVVFAKNAKYSEVSMVKELTICGIDPMRIEKSNFNYFVNSVVSGYVCSLPRRALYEKSYGHNSWYLKNYEATDLSSISNTILKEIKTNYLKVVKVITDPSILAARKAKKAAYAAARAESKQQHELAQKAALKAIEQFDILNS